MKLLDTRSPEIKAKSKSIKKRMWSLVVAHSKVLEARDMLRDLLRCDSEETEAMLISAPTGSGKTNFGKAVFRNLSEGIEHEAEADKRPVIIIKSPNSSNKGAMAYLLLKALGDVSPTKGSVDERLERIVNYLKLQEVKLIIIDETHNYLPTKPTTHATQAIHFLKNLLNEGSTPILFMGTKHAENLINFYGEIRSRICTRVIKFNNLSISTQHEQIEFAKVLEAYAKLLNETGTKITFFKDENGRKVLKSQRLIQCFWLATGGNLRKIRNLFYRMVDAVLEEGASSLKDLAQVWRGQMNPTINYNPLESKNAKKVEKTLKVRGMSN